VKIDKWLDTLSKTFSGKEVIADKVCSVCDKKLHGNSKLLVCKKCRKKEINNGSK